MKRLRICASCEWLFKSDDPICPKCKFGSYLALYACGQKAYKYFKNQIPWKKKQLINFELKLDKEISKRWPMPIIQIDENFSISRDPHNWVLHENITTQNADGVITCKVKKTFHPSFEKIARYMLDKKIGNSETLIDVLKTLKSTEETLTQYLQLLS